MKLPDSKNIRFEITDHAIVRFRERIDPTANAEDIDRYLRESTVTGARDQWLKRLGFYGTLNLAGSLILVYHHVLFLVKPHKDCKRVAVVVTTMRKGMRSTHD